MVLVERPAEKPKGSFLLEASSEDLHRRAETVLEKLDGMSAREQIPHLKTLRQETETALATIRGTGEKDAADLAATRANLGMVASADAVPAQAPLKQRERELTEFLAELEMRENPRKEKKSDDETSYEQVPGLREKFSGVADALDELNARLGKRDSNQFSPLLDRRRLSGASADLRAGISNGRNLPDALSAITSALSKYGGEGPVRDSKESLSSVNAALREFVDSINRTRSKLAEDPDRQKEFEEISRLATAAQKTLDTHGRKMTAFNKFFER